MDNVREKLVELLEDIGVIAEEDCGFDRASGGRLIDFHGAEYVADYLIANGVTVQDAAYWTDVMDCGVGNCFGICSNCRTQQKAASYASLMTEYRHCRWCGAKMTYTPPNGE